MCKYTLYIYTYVYKLIYIYISTYVYNSPQMNTLKKIVLSLLYTFMDTAR